MDNDPLSDFSPPKEPKTGLQRRAWSMEYGIYRGRLRSMEEYDLEIREEAHAKERRQCREECLPAIHDLITDEEFYVVGWTLPPELKTSRDAEYIKEEVRKECARVWEVRSKREETEVWSLWRPHVPP
jgi:hypothetical protein